MLGMRSFLALALVSRALALPTLMNDAHTTASDDSTSNVFVKASALRSTCDKLKAYGQTDAACDSPQYFAPADLCRSAMTGEDGNRLNPLLKLALGKITSTGTGSSSSPTPTQAGDGVDDNGFNPLLKLALGKLTSTSTGTGSSSIPTPTHAVNDVLAKVKAKLANGGGDSTATPGPFDGSLAKVKAALPNNNDGGDKNTADILKDVEHCDCEDDAPSSTDSAAATLSVSVTASASASATAAMSRRNLGFVSSQLASMHVTATRADTTSESASPTGYSREGSSYGALSADQLMSGSLVAVSMPEDDETESDEVLAKRDQFLSATSLASLALTASRTATSTQSASPTGYSGFDSDSSSFDYTTFMDSALTQFEDKDDVPMYV
ncbi:hypothetical protein EXIGLDRAFT_752325 [Exidia glandulosa HHB12029]|uniref:Uncharacterized protein n=1 Tax=Exidia glandulosa HHB12029 TaxID=1314781 RepID=A0A165EMU5_EXIGL|nr:hypothetical protein EXIGLDRAFT_752325 [Exidia glandulosa HHB12029]